MSLPALAKDGAEKQDMYHLPLHTFVRLESNRALHAPRSAKIDVWATSLLVPQLSLRRCHFLAATLLALVATVGGLVVFLLGVPIDRKVDDSVGTTAKADGRVSYYQTVSGFALAGLGLVLEEIFKPFLAAILVYAANRPWQPDEVITSGPTQFKRNVLFWMTPLAMYIVNIGWSSVYIEHTDNGVVHGFVDADLVDTQTLSVNAMSFDPTLTSVHDTVLRVAVTGQARPLQINPSSTCSSETNAQNEHQSASMRMDLPSLLELQRTSVAYGFPPRVWNLDAMPTALQPTHQAQLSQDPKVHESNERELAEFLRQTGERYGTLEDLLVQGLTLHGKVTSEFNLDRNYTCDTDEGLCYGVRNPLESVHSLDQSATPSAVNLFRFLPNNTGGLAPEEATISLEQYQISASVSIVALTIDVPFAKNEDYRFIDRSSCNDGGTFVDRDEASRVFLGDIALAERNLCDGTYLNYSSPSNNCGTRNCLLYDHTNAFRMEKQVLLTSYMDNCDHADVRYDANLSSWYPEGCTPRANTAFLYGVGSYIGGNFAKRGGRLGPEIMNTRGHFIMTFTKMEWHLDDLSSRFGARCADTKSNCKGLVHALSSTNDGERPGRVLVVGQRHIPVDHVTRTLKDPIPLVLLREPVSYYEDGTYYTVEYVDTSLMNTTYTKDDTLGLDRGHCSVHIDAYLNMVEANHYYMADPRQPLYTSALFYLFQNAQVKAVSPSSATHGLADLSNTFIGRARMQGDLEVKEIRYSVSLASAVSSWLGVCIMLMYTVVMIRWPRDAVRLTDQSNAAAHCADVLIDRDALYPRRVYTRQLRFLSGAVVDMDDYAVESITFCNVEHAQNAFEMQ